MTASERADFDNEPLWLDENQVLWLLEQRGAKADLLRAAEIATELKMTTARATSALGQLRAQGKAGTRRVGRSEMWGSPEQLRTLDEANRRAQAAENEERRRIEDHNRVMRETRRELEQVFGGTDVGVTSLESTFPGYSNQPQRDYLLIGISKPTDAAWLLGRLRHPAPDEGKPTEEQLADFYERMDDLLHCLTWAGWESFEGDEWNEYDRECGPVLHTTLRRTCMAIDVEFYPSKDRLLLRPFEDVVGEWPPVFSMLDDDMSITVGNDLEGDRAAVRRKAGEAGLLDATRISIDRHRAMSLSEFFVFQDIEWIYKPAAAERGVTIDHLLGEISNEPDLPLFINFVRGIAGANVLPDRVPDAVVLGVAAWCWRNDTAVEAFHLPDDVLMSRVNMAVSAAIQPHVDPFDGIDWAGLKPALTDRELQLPDGRVVADLFGDGWTEVRRTVEERLDTWQRIDEQVLGAEATMRLLTIGGSTSYTCHWWGQGRWPTIVRRIATDAVEADVPLPAPYDREGLEALIAALEEPQLLTDDVLNWLIDMPTGGPDGPCGLRHHEVSRPVVRRLDLRFDDEEPEQAGPG